MMKPGIPQYCYIICIMITLNLGCTRHPEIPTQSTYTFVNQTGKTISFDLYSSQEDYNQNTNRIQQYTLNQGAAQKIVLDVLKSYWIDWYSADYSVNNWEDLNSARSSPSPKITIAAEDDSYPIKANSPDTTRAIILNGNGQSSEWLAIITNGGSLNGTHRFTFRKNFTGTYTFKDPNGGSTEQAFTYSLISSTLSSGRPVAFRLTLSTAQVPNSYNVTCNPGLGISPRTGKDSMLIRFNKINPSTDFMATRQ